MSQWPPPPPPNNGYGLGHFDIGNLPDVDGYSGNSGNNLMSDATAAAIQQQMDNAQDNDALMSFFDNNMLDFTGDMVMNMDASDDGAMQHAFDQSMVGTTNALEPAGDRMMGLDTEMNVPGGGPLPPGGPVQSNASGQLTLSSTNALSDFTKRRNWPAKVVEELQDFLQILDANGRIKYASRSITEVAGYAVDEIQDMLLKDLIHPDDQGLFVAELNESIASGNTLRMYYRLKKKDGNYAIFEAIGHAHIAAAKFAPNPNNQSPFCQAVFIMARPYPTKNASLLDSFLEHKIENERLKRRIAELRREEEADADDAQQQWNASQDGRSELTPSEITSTAPRSQFRSPSNENSPYQPRNSLNAALTKENLEGSTVGGLQDSLRDKMARYEGASHTDTIEMLTGLRYTEGERSRGITTGNTSPALVKGDAGIAIPKDRDGRIGDKKKKKLKASEEYVCTDCGTLDSPEWRKGPSGPKTLCNACGLRWAKKEKKRGSIHTAQQTPQADYAMG